MEEEIMKFLVTLFANLKGLFSANVDPGMEGIEGNSHFVDVLPSHEDGGFPLFV